MMKAMNKKIEEKFSEHESHQLIGGGSGSTCAYDVVEKNLINEAYYNNDL